MSGFEELQSMLAGALPENYTLPDSRPLNDDEILQMSPQQREEAKKRYFERMQKGDPNATRSFGRLQGFSTDNVMMKNAAAQHARDAAAVRDAGADWQPTTALPRLSAADARARQVTAPDMSPAPLDTSKWAFEPMDIEGKLPVEQAPVMKFPPMDVEGRMPAAGPGLAGSPIGGSVGAEVMRDYLAHPAGQGAPKPDFRSWVMSRGGEPKSAGAASSPEDQRLGAVVESEALQTELSSLERQLAEKEKALAAAKAGGAAGTAAPSAQPIGDVHEPDLSPAARAPVPALGTPVRGEPPAPATPYNDEEILSGMGLNQQKRAYLAKLKKTDPDVYAIELKRLGSQMATIKDNAAAAVARQKQPEFVDDSMNAHRQDLHPMPGDSVDSLRGRLLRRGKVADVQKMLDSGTIDQRTAMSLLRDLGDYSDEDFKKQRQAVNEEALYNAINDPKSMANDQVAPWEVNAANMFNDTKDIFRAGAGLRGAPQHENPWVQGQQNFRDWVMKRGQMARAQEQDAQKKALEERELDIKARLAGAKEKNAASYGKLSQSGQSQLQALRAEEKEYVSQLADMDKNKAKSIHDYVQAGLKTPEAVTAFNEDRLQLVSRLKATRDAISAGETQVKGDTYKPVGITNYGTETSTTGDMMKKQAAINKALAEKEKQRKIQNGIPEGWTARSGATPSDKAKETFAKTVMALDGLKATGARYLEAAKAAGYEPGMGPLSKGANTLKQMLLGDAETRTQVAQTATTMLMRVKDLYDLGALTDSDYSTATKIIGNPQDLSWQGINTDNFSQLQGLIQEAEDKVNNMARAEGFERRGAGAGADASTPSSKKTATGGTSAPKKVKVMYKNGVVDEVSPRVADQLRKEGLLK